MRATIQLAFILLVFFSVLLALGCGRGGGCDKDCRPDEKDSKPDNSGPRPHAHEYGEKDAGKSLTVHAGDVARIKLGEGWQLVGRGIPHLILEDTERGGVYRFRVAAPGSCSLRFAHGKRELSFSFHVRP